MEKPRSGDEIVLMDNARVARTLRRISYEIIETYHTSGPVVFAGMNQKGTQIAETVKKHVTEAGLGVDGCYRIHTNLPFDEQVDALPPLNDRNIILFDDVIFSGKSLLKALGFVFRHGEPASIGLAVLVDRGHRRYPISPGFVGMHYPTKLKEHVSVVMDGRDKSMTVVLKSDYGI